MGIKGAKVIIKMEINLISLIGVFLVSWMIHLTRYISFIIIVKIHDSILLKIDDAKFTYKKTLQCQ
jgi:hypothetical protein